MNTADELINALKLAGLRPTPQRLAICRFLIESKEHPTAAMIYEHLRPQYPSLSVMTVYNTLNTLVKLGKVNVLGDCGDDHAHYDADTSPHINLACILCHRIVDIDIPQVEELDREVNRATGYKLLGARMMYYGLCPDCQTSKVL
jgi:Fur family peroxide stress response transcriptional regulator